MEDNIVNLEVLVAALPRETRAIVRRIYQISTTVGHAVPPPEMYAWIERQFGSLGRVEEQRIVKVTNVVTFEGALFNELRASRPMEARTSSDLEARIVAGRAEDTFADPLTGTPADVFGRLKGQHSITASNVAKYDGFHGVLIFDEYNPLAFTSESIADALATAQRWGAMAMAADARARYFFFMWNCLWKSGASILHGHTQMTVTSDFPYAKVEQLRRAAHQYRQQHGQSYFADLVSIHTALGLAKALAGGITAFVSLTPVKEKEVWLLGAALDENMAAAIYRVLSVYRSLGVSSFNVAAYLPPNQLVDGDTWTDFPAIVRLVDRGDPLNQTADIGAMELFAQSVVSSDPFKLAARL